MTPNLPRALMSHAACWQTVHNGKH